MLRKEFIGSALALVVGVNLAAWALVVPSEHAATPVGSPAIISVSQTASIAALDATTTIGFPESTSTVSSSTTSQE